MKKLIKPFGKAGAILIAGILAGCTTVTSTVSEQSGPTNKVTSFRATSFFDAKNDLNKFNAGMTKAGQKIGLGSLAEESSGSNAVSMVEGVTAAAVGAAIKAAK